MLFFIQEFVHMFFPGAVGPGNLVASKNLMPNESMEMSMKTSESDSTKRAQTNSVVDSNSTSAQQSLQNTLQNQQSLDHSTSKDYSQYDSAQNTITSNNIAKTSGFQSRAAVGLQNIGSSAGQVAAGALSLTGASQSTQNAAQNIGTGVGGILSGIANIVTGGLPLDANTGIKVDTSNATTSNAQATSGSSTDANDSRDDATQAMQEAVSNNAQQTNSTRSVAVTDSTESTTESTKEDSQTRTFKNPNRSSCLNINFYQNVQSFTGVSLWVNERVMFSNGVVAQTVPLSGLQNILDTIVQAAHPEAKQAVWNFVASTLKVVDWQGRMVDMLDESTGSKHVKDDFYFDLLEDANLPTVPADELIKPFNESLRGVVMDINTYTMGVPGVYADAQPGHVCLDPNETKLFDLEVKRKELANARSEKENTRIDIDNEVQADKKDFCKSISDPEERRQAYFELLTDGRAILDRTYLENWMDNLRGGRRPRPPQMNPPPGAQGANPS
jgi:hypothetical protein